METRKERERSGYRGVWTMTSQESSARYATQRFAAHCTLLGILLPLLVVPIARGAGSDEASSETLGTLQEIVVTAQKRSENIQDVPITITAISAQQLQASGIQTMADLPTVTSGLTVSAPGGYESFHLRGVGTPADAASLENPIATYVDGVYIGHQVGASLQNLVNIEQVEVDKGPQGTLFGRNATGGLIQITTLDPTQAPGASLTAGYGNYDTSTGSVYVTGGITDQLAADFSGYLRNQIDGYGVNFYNGQEINKENDSALRSKWLYTPDDATRFAFTMDYEKENGTPAEAPFPGTIPPGGLVPTRPQDIYVAASVFDHGWEYGLSLKATHTFDIGEFNSITAYRRSDYEIPFPNVSPVLADITIPLLFDIYRQFSQEFQLGSTTNSGIRWVTGAFLYAASAGWRPVEIYGPALSPLVIDIYDEQKTYSAALYGQATFPIADATNFTVGGRYTYDRRNWEGSEIFTGYPLPGAYDSEHEIAQKPTWRLSLDHHFTPDVMGFISDNRGFKSGGFNDSQVPALKYDPETLDAYEMGVKTTLLDRRLWLDTSVFYYNYKNIQTTRFIDGNENIYNGSGAHIYGVDLDVKFQVTDALRITTGVEYLHDRYTSFPLADYTVPAVGGGDIYSTRNAEGNRLAMVPDWTATVAGDYRVPISMPGTLRANVTYAYNGGWFANPDNRLKQPEYSVVNASLNWSSPDYRYRVSLWGKNLSNANYAIFGTEQANGDNIYYAPPRTFGLTGTVNFGSLAK
jgi:iron complex outermembrane recepter protein